MRPLLRRPWGCFLFAGLVLAGLMPLRGEPDAGAVLSGIGNTIFREFVVSRAEAKKNRGRQGRSQNASQLNGTNAVPARKNAVTVAPSGPSKVSPVSGGTGGSNSGKNTGISATTRETSVKGASNSLKTSKAGATKGKSDSGDGAKAQDDTGVSDAGPPKTLDRMLGLKKDKPDAAAPAQNKPRPATANVKDAPLAKFSKRDDILVKNLNAAGKKRMEALGFKVVETKKLKSNGNAVSRVIPPSGMRGAKAMDVLANTAPDITAFANQSYAIPVAAPPAYGTAFRQAPGEADRKPAIGPRTGQCRDDRCFGRLAIGWNENLSSCAKKIKIGVIDTPVDISHPALANQNIKVGSFLNDRPRSTADWHGTAVLSLLSGRFDSGVPGLAPDAEYYVAEAFQTEEDGVTSSSTEELLQSLEWLDRFGVKIVNMSFSGPRDPLVEETISRMQSRGVQFVAAAGNFGKNAEPSYPAAYKDVIAVTAVNKDNQNYIHANHGDYVDLSAPGVRIWTALANGEEGYRTGTSFAAPFVTGILAASLNGMGSKPMDKNTLLSRLEIKDLGSPGKDPIYGYGLPIAPKTCASPRMEVASKKPAAPAAPDATKPASWLSNLTVTPAVPAFTSGSAIQGLGFSQ